MLLGISNVHGPSAVTDAAFVETFDEDLDVLAVAKGSQLFIHPIQYEKISDPIIKEFYSEIRMIIPIHHPLDDKSNIFLVNSNFIGTVIDSNYETLTTLSLLSNGLTISPEDVKYAVHPKAVAFQFSNSHIDVFRVSSVTTIEPSFPISIGCKRIIDFTFIAINSTLVRLAALCEEFNQPPSLHLFIVDLTQCQYSEDKSIIIPMPVDSYKLLSLEEHACVVAFSTKQAVRVEYDKSLTPVKTTATIFTPHPISKIVHLTQDFYVSIDKVNNMKIVELKTEGQVHFLGIETTLKPAALVKISDSVVFVGTDEDESTTFQINTESKLATPLDKFKQAGKFKSMQLTPQGYEANFANKTILIKKYVSLKQRSRYPTNFCERIFSYGDMLIYSNSNSTYEMSSYLDTAYESLVKDEKAILFKNISGKLIYVFENSMRIDKNDYELKSKCLSAAINQEYIATSSTNNIIYIYSHEGALTNQIKFQRRITAISFTNIFLIVTLSYPNEIQFYHVHDFALVRKNSLENSIAAIELINDSIVLASYKGDCYIASTNSTKMQVIPCSGFHSSICQYKSDFIICGEKPVFVRDSIPVQIEGSAFTAAVAIDSNIYIAGPALILSCQIGEEIRQIELQDVYDVKNEGMIARDGMIFDEDNEIIASFNEEIINFVKYNQTIFVQTVSGIFKYIIDSREIDIITRKAILGLGMFCGMLIASSADRIIEVTTKKVIFEATLPMKCISWRDNFFVTANTSNYVTLYQYEKNEVKFVSDTNVCLPISAILLLNNYVIAGTPQGILLLIEISFYVFSIVDQFNIGEPIVQITRTKDGSIFAGTSLGRVVRINLFKALPKFVDFYNILNDKIHSIGGFSKKDQDMTYNMKYIRPAKQMFDLDLVRKFQHMSVAEKETIIKQANISVDEADELSEVMILK